MPRRQILETPLADHLLLAVPGQARLHLLNPTAAWVWQTRQMSVSGGELASELARHFDIPLARARGDLAAILQQWRQAGLLAQGKAEVSVQSSAAQSCQQNDRAALPVAEHPVRAKTQGDFRSHVSLRSAESSVDLLVDDPALAATLAPIIAPLQAVHETTDGETPPISLHLTGVASAWTLLRDHQPIASGTRGDSAVTSSISEIIEIGCHARQRMMILHAAGLVYEGRGLLLIGPGGSGKSTLAMALNQQGLPLLGDDVIPITQAGKLQGIGMSVCVKAGSWPAVAALRPEIAQCTSLQRLDTQVRYLPPLGSLPAAPVDASWLIFPDYQAGISAHYRQLSPAEALQRLLQAEPLLGVIDQQSLDSLALWIQARPAVQISYGNTATGMELAMRACAGR